MKKKTDIDDFKSDFIKMKIPDMKTIQQIDYGEDISNFLSIIKHQDKEDEKYLIRKKILPILSGIIILVILFLVIPIQNHVILFGSLMVFLGLMAILILFLRDYINISKETFGQSLRSYLQTKLSRLKSWQSTPKLYNVIFIFFVFGCCLMLLGNTGFISALNSTRNAVVFIVAYVCAFAISWALAEYNYRRRHKKQHDQLVREISDLLRELEKY
jgi:hypothetical protein